MTDKVQKIREKVEKLKSNLIYGACSSQIAMVTRCKEEAYDEVLTLLDTMQEEYVSNVWHDAKTDPPQAKKKILATNEYGACEVNYAINMALYWPKVIKWAYIDDLLNLDNFCQSCKNLQEEPISRTSADIEAAMQEVEEKSEAFTEAHQGEDADTILAQMRGEDPVSEDLEEEIKQYLNKEVIVTNEDVVLSKHHEFHNFYVENLEEVARHFANWQKQQMIKDATDVTVHIEAGNYPYIPQLELYDYDKDIPLAKEGDKYKVILIKED